MLLTIAGLYLKWNLLLAIGGVLAWLLSDRLMLLSGNRISNGTILSHLRALFLLLLLLPVFHALIAMVNPGMLQTIKGLSSGSLVGELSVSADLDAGLGRIFTLGILEVSVVELLLFTMTAGFVHRGMRLKSLHRQLSAIIMSGTEWKSIASVELLFSASITSPFSTRALGKRHVVLPIELLETPGHLRLAIKHELQHIRNGDLEWVLLVELCKLLCFWNPAIYLWQYQFDSLQELACDEALVTRKGVDVHKYSHCLVDIASRGSNPVLVASSNMVPKLMLFSDGAAHLKRRLRMMQKSGQSDASRLLTSIHLLMLLLISGGCSMFVLEEGRGITLPPRPDNDFPEYLPVSTQMPRYPRVALQENIEGWVLVSFTVTENGDVTQSEVIDGCAHRAEQKCDPVHEDVFKESALAAINQFRFEPRMENGSPVATPGVRYVFRFELEND